MPVAEERACGALPLAVLLDEGLERAQQLVAVLAAAVLERAEHAVAEEAQGVVVLQREQELERAEIAVRGHVRAGVAVPRRQRRRLERTARLVEAAPERRRRSDAAGCRARIAVPFRQRLARPPGQLDRIEIRRVDDGAQQPLTRSHERAVTGGRDRAVEIGLGGARIGDRIYEDGGAR